MIIYKAINKINGKVYIGKTIKSLNDRISRHYFQPSNALFHRALKKYGMGKFEFTVIDSAETNELLNDKEKYWIKTINCRHPNGYNLTEGGNGMAGLHPSEETRKKLRLAAKGNKKFLGKKHTAETKVKCSMAKIGNKARLGMPHRQSTKDKISKSHSGEKSSSAKLNWEQVYEVRKIYSIGRHNQTQLAKEYGITPSTMNSLVRNKTWIEK